MTSTPAIDEKYEGLPPRRSPEWYTAIGFEKPWGLQFASFYEKLSFGWGAPLLEKGSYGQVTEEMADALPPPEDEAPLRAQQFADCYDQGQVRARVYPPVTPLFGLEGPKAHSCMYKLAYFVDCTIAMLQEDLASGRIWFLKSNLFARTILHLHWRRMALHGFWTLLEVVVRCAVP